MFQIILFNLCCHTLGCWLSNSCVILVKFTIWQLLITGPHSGSRGWGALSLHHDPFSCLVLMRSLLSCWESLQCQTAVCYVCVYGPVCVHAYGTPGTHRTRRHQTVTCVVLVTVPVCLFPYQTNLGTCSTGAGQQRSLAKLSSLNMKSEKKETHTSYMGW